MWHTPFRHRQLPACCPPPGCLVGRQTHTASNAIFTLKSLVEKLLRKGGGFMATNPRIPEPDNHARVHEEDSKKGHFPIPILIILAAAAILAALIWYFPKRVPTAPPS